MKIQPIRFSRHAQQQMVIRGASRDEVIEAIRQGDQVPAKRGRKGFRKNFPYNRLWSGRMHNINININFINKIQGVTTHRLTEEVAIDYASNGQIAGIEVLDASEYVFTPSAPRRVEVQNLIPIAA